MRRRWGCQLAGLLKRTMKTNLHLGIFLYFFVVCELTVAGGDIKDLTLRDDPRVLTVVCGANVTSNRVILLDLHDADTIEARAGNCTIINLTAKLVVAEKLTIRAEKKGSRIKLLLERGILAAIPCFENNQLRPSEQVVRLGTYDREFLPSDIIRINGETMTFRDAAKRFPELPQRQVRPPQ